MPIQHAIYVHNQLVQATRRIPHLIAKTTVNDKYIKMEKDSKFRALVAEQIGLGFELQRAETVTIVPNAPNSQETEVTVSI